MLISILFDVQYSQKPIFSFEKGSNGQNHSSPGSHHLVKKSPPLQQNFWSPLLLPSLTAFWEILETAVQKENMNFEKG